MSHIYRGIDLYCLLATARQPVDMPLDHGLLPFPSLLRHGRFGLRIEYQLRRLLPSSTDLDSRFLRLALVSSVQQCMRKTRANMKTW